MKRVVLVEDDLLQANSIKVCIMRHLVDVEVEVIEDESDFCEWLARLAPGDSSAPVLIVSCMMMPWDSERLTDPPEVSKDFRFAGSRCWKRFRERADLKHIPWIYNTVLDELTMQFEKNCDIFTGYAQKSRSIDPLLSEIDSLLAFVREVAADPAFGLKMQEILRKGMGTPLEECQTQLP